MDEDLENLEASLRELRPAAPSPRVAEAIAEALTEGQLVVGAALRRDLNHADKVSEREAPPRTTPAERRRLWWAAAATLPIAAAIALTFFLSARTVTRRQPAASARDVLKPIAAKDVLYAASDEGLVALADGGRARKQRLEFVATVTWRDPKTNASLTWTVPREEVRIVPVRYQ